MAYLSILIDVGTLVKDIQIFARLLSCNWRLILIKYSPDFLVVIGVFGGCLAGRFWKVGPALVGVSGRFYIRVQAEPWLWDDHMGW